MMQVIIETDCTTGELSSTISRAKLFVSAENVHTMAGRSLQLKADVEQTRGQTCAGLGVAGGCPDFLSHRALSGLAIVKLN